MKRYIIYSILIAFFAASCTDFGSETQLDLPAGPTVEISNVVAETNSITFKLSPKGTAGFYSWLVKAGETPDSGIDAQTLLEVDASGVAGGTVSYKLHKDTVITVSKLTAYTVYQIYAVGASTDGMVSTISTKAVRTLDDGESPTPSVEDIAVADTVVTIPFQEPIQRGTGKIFVSYFAINTLSVVDSTFDILPEFEEFNKQDIEISEENITVSGDKLILTLLAPPAGAYASITFESGAVKDLEGNSSIAFTEKANIYKKGALLNGLTVRLAKKSWKLESEFASTDPDFVSVFTEWQDLMILTLPEEGIVLSKKAGDAGTSQVIYKGSGRTVTVDVSSWGITTEGVGYLLPEEPTRGSVVDLIVPAGIVEDVYGNPNAALTVENNYLYSYGYDYSDVIGAYNVDLVSYWDGQLPTVSGIIIDKDPETDDLIIKNLFLDGTEISGVFDPVVGTITLDDEQLLMEDVQFSSGSFDVYFVNGASSDPVVFQVPASGRIESPDQIWGFYVDGAGWYDAFTASTWTRISTSTIPTAAPSSVGPLRLREAPISDGSLRKITRKN